MSGTTTDRRVQQIASLFTRDFFFFIPPSIPRPRGECRRGMKKKKTHSEADTQELQHTKHRLHVCQVTLCSPRASAPQECAGKQAECALGLSCFEGTTSKIKTRSRGVKLCERGFKGKTERFSLRLKVNENKCLYVK